MLENIFMLEALNFSVAGFNGLSLIASILVLTALGLSTYGLWARKFYLGVVLGNIVALYFILALAFKTSAATQVLGGITTSLLVLWVVQLFSINLVYYTHRTEFSKSQKLDLFTKLFKLPAFERCAEQKKRAVN